MFSLRGATKRYGERIALHPTDLEIARGRTTVLLGTSGCGKSTIIRMLVGLVRPDAGEVLFEGRPLTEDNVLAARRRMGYVIQEGGLFPHLDVRGNAALVARWLGWSAARIGERIETLAELVRLPRPRLGQRPTELSGGERQRAGLMRALMLDPEVLLLDEPMGALDPIIRRELQEDLRAVFGRLQKTVVLVTHDLGEAAFFADTVVLLRDGRVVQEGAIAELWGAPADPFVTRFIQAQRPLDLPPPGAATEAP